MSELFIDESSLLAGSGVPEKEIEEAEKKLGLKFSDEYREYLLHYGIAAYRGHELTGLTKSTRVNVANVTTEERKPGIPDNLYVVECTNVEEIIIWQSATGEIYASSPNMKLTKINDTLKDFLNK